MKSLSWYWRGTLLFVAAICFAAYLDGSDRRTRQVGRYQMTASSTYMHVLDTMTGRVHTYRMRLDMMDNICIQHTPRCTEEP